MGKFNQAQILFCSRHSMKFQQLFFNFFPYQFPKYHTGCCSYIQGMFHAKLRYFYRAIAEAYGGLLNTRNLISKNYCYFFTLLPFYVLKMNAVFNLLNCINSVPFLPQL